MSQNRFSLEIYTGMNSKHRCPRCEDKKSFTYYIDVETGEPLGDKVGRCDHESSCGYHYPPRHYFADNGKSDWYEKQIKQYVPPPPAPISYFARKHMTDTLNNYQDNNLVQFLLGTFPANAVMAAVDAYRIGTSDYWQGATVFWRIDKMNRVCEGKIMHYDKTTGKRIKRGGKACIYSMRKILQKQGEIEADFEQKKGFFGEHLLRGNEKPVKIVESEKTAIIASIVYSDYIWIACGSRGFLTDVRMKLVKERNVTLYPDNDAYGFWNDKAVRYNCKISNVVKTYCNGNSDDLADFVLNQYGYTIGTFFHYFKQCASIRAP